MTETFMYQEAAEAAGVVRRQQLSLRPKLREIAAALANLAPPFIVTCARGSSDHAALYGKYLIETQLGVVVASYAPSVGSIYGRSPKIGSGLCLAISQSGRSPDLLSVVSEAKRQGVPTLAIVNDDASPLAKLADHVLPILAGPERSVAATKSYIGSLSLIFALTAHWSGDPDLLDAWERLPDLLDQSWQFDWSSLGTHLQTSRGLYVIGRGPGFGVAAEAALKFKETCGLHAEAFSSAEVKHGPMAIIDEEFPLLLFRQDDSSAPGIDGLIAEMAARHVPVFVCSTQLQECVPASIQPLAAATAHPMIQPILQIQSFYRMINGLALSRGLNPDAPPTLRKVTETL